jgi:hypothetical protein
MPRPPVVIHVDRETERRNARLQYAGLLAVFAILMYLTTSDKRLYLALVPPLVAVLGYRIWAVERFSPSLAQHYARAVVGHAADALLGAFRRDSYLTAVWTQAGVELHRLYSLPPAPLVPAMHVLSMEAFPVTRLPGMLHHLNRAFSRALGAGLGLAFMLPWSWSGHASRIPGMFGWPIWLAFAVLVVFRLWVWRHNRRQITRIIGAVRTDPRAELMELLAPPWQPRRHALITELNRLADHVDHTARPRPEPELRVLTLLLACGAALGLAGGALSWLT